MRLSQMIAKEVMALKKDLMTRDYSLSLKNPMHKHIIENIVANEKTAYNRRLNVKRNP